MKEGRRVGGWEGKRVYEREKMNLGYILLKINLRRGFSLKHILSCKTTKNRCIKLKFGLAVKQKV